MNRKLFLEVLPCSIDFSDFNALLIDIAFPITQKHEVVILERLRPTVRGGPRKSDSRIKCKIRQTTRRSHRDEQDEKKEVFRGVQSKGST